MWKDFFYFSKSERRAILFLLTLLFIFMCIWVLFPVKEESLEQDQEGIEEIKNFLAGVHEMEEKESLRYSYDKPKRREVVLAAFDPNSADSIEFLQRGLPPFIAHTILQYRRAGGKFRTADDFSRVYGLSSEKFNMLKPYIQISEAFRRKQDTLHFIKKAEKDTLAVYKYPEGTLVDLNEADTILIYIVHFLQLSHIIKTSQTFPVSHNHACNATAYSRNLFQLGSVRFIQID